MKLVRFVAGMAGMAVLATPTLASADPGQQDDLDTWRPNVSYAKMLAEQCNP